MLMTLRGLGGDLQFEGNPLMRAAIAVKESARRVDGGRSDPAASGVRARGASGRPRSAQAHRFCSGPSVTGGNAMKFFLVLVLGVMSCTGYVAYQKLGPPSEPYRAYQQYATSSLRGGQMAARKALVRFGASGQVPDTGGISYKLESQTRNGSDSVEIVAIQYVTRVYRDSFGQRWKRG